MSEHLEFEDRFGNDLRTVFPASSVPEAVAEDHVAAMMAEAQLLVGEGAHAPAGRSDAAVAPQASRRRSMSDRMFRRVLAVIAAVVLSLGGLAVAGAFPGSGPDDDDQAVVTDVSADDQVDVAEDEGENEDADDQGDDEAETDENDQGEDGDDQGENEDGDEVEAEDDQGNEVEADENDQGEDGDDQGEDADDQGQDESSGDEENGDQGGDDQGDGGSEEKQDDGQNDDGGNSDE